MVHGSGVGGAWHNSVWRNAMTITVEAVYENGVLKPAQPLPLAEHERLEIVV
jgi:hypothetical protein